MVGSALQAGGGTGKKKKQGLLTRHGSSVVLHALEQIMDAQLQSLSSLERTARDLRLSVMLDSTLRHPRSGTVAPRFLGVKVTGAASIDNMCSKMHQIRRYCDTHGLHLVLMYTASQLSTLLAHGEEYV